MLMYKDYMLRGGFSRKCHSYCLHHRKQNLLTLTHVQHGRSTKGIKTFHVVLQCNPGGYEYLGTATLTTLTKELCPVKCKTRRGADQCCPEQKNLVLCTKAPTALSGYAVSFHPSSGNHQSPRNSLTIDHLCVLEYWAFSLRRKSNVSVYEGSVWLTGLHEFI